MDDDTLERMRSWNARSIDDPGDLGGGFTGAVDVGGTWVLVVDGQCVSGDPETLTAGGEAYTAPHDALPLLFAMQSADGAEQGEYYTEETPLRETHETLTEASFSGYLELAENVLSGDYYIVYHGGRSRSVAFVGENRRLVTDDEAFDAAADEVGIYRVMAVDIDAKPLPGGTATEGSTGGTTATAATGREPAAAAADADAERPEMQSSEDQSETAGDGDDGGDPKRAPDAAASGDDTATGSDSGAVEARQGVDEPRGGPSASESDSTQSSGDVAGGASPSGTGDPTPASAAAGDNDAIGPTIERIDSRLQTIERRIDRMDQQLDRIEEGAEEGGDPYAIPTESEEESQPTEDAEPATGRSALWIGVLLILLALMAVGIAHYLDVITISLPDGVTQQIRETTQTITAGR